MILIQLDDSILYLEKGASSALENFQVWYVSEYVSIDMLQVVAAQVQTSQVPELVKDASGQLLYPVVPQRQRLQLRYVDKGRADLQQTCENIFLVKINVVPRLAMDLMRLLSSLRVLSE